MTEKPLPEKIVFSFYTYARCEILGENRWADDGIRDFFFKSPAQAKEAVWKLKDELDQIGETDAWSPVQIEKIQTVPVTQDSFLALLNGEIESIVQSYEVIETIS